MGTDKRERKKANRNAKLEAERAAEARTKRRATIRTMMIAGVVIVIGMVLISALSGCGTSSEDGGQSEGDVPEFSIANKPFEVDEDAVDPATYDTTECPPADGVSTPVIDFEDPPPDCIDPAKAYTAAIETSEGTVTLELDTDRTPGTTNNFVVLARWGYFDGTDLFRTEAATGIIQGGSPHTQDNSDQGPGYTIADEGGPFSSDDYAPGTIAMANTGAPNSASAQFFFLANEGGSYLGDKDALGPAAGTYAVFGRATDGLDVLGAIAALDDGSGVPSRQVTIETVSITEA